MSEEESNYSIPSNKSDELLAPVTQLKHRPDSKVQQVYQIQRRAHHLECKSNLKNWYCQWS